MAVHEITLGKSGGGKTYSLVHRLVNEWLPFPHHGIYFTNLPLDLDAIASFFVKNRPELFSQGVMARIHIFTAKDTQGWLREESGPWDYFHDKDMQGGRIVIDEVHNYVHTGSSKDYVNKWRMWLGEIRHMQCTAEFVSQYETKVHPLIRHEAGLIRRVSSSDDYRDKLFWVRYYDHFQLLSKLRGYYASRVWVQEVKEKDGKWAVDGGGSIPLIPEFYNLYNSYSAPIAGNAKSIKKLNPHPYARMKWADLLRWYFSRNAVRIGFFCCIYVVLGWLFVGGGIAQIFVKVTSSVASGKQPEKETKLSEKSVPAAPVVVPTKPAIVSVLGTFDAHGKPWSEHHVYPPTPPVLVPSAQSAGAGRVQ